MTPLNMLLAVREALPRLSRAERRVAEAVLADPHRVIDRSISVLAGDAVVSQPTIVRFCRRVGCSGFQDFKVQLAQSLGAGLSYLDMDVQRHDGPDVYTQKVFDSNISTLIGVRNQLSAQVIERAVDALAQARKIEFYGFVASGAVAMDAQHKFFHFAVPCVAYADLHMQLMSAAALGPCDVVVAISHTGRTTDLIASVRLARSAGATVIAVTEPGSPLAEESSLVIGIDVPENTDVYMPTMSRIAHLLVIDVLAVGVALRGGERTAERLRKMKLVLQDRRVSKEQPEGAQPERGREGRTMA